jgi:hypothetical protein
VGEEGLGADVGVGDGWVGCAVGSEVETGAVGEVDGLGYEMACRGELEYG